MDYTNIQIYNILIAQMLKDKLRAHLKIISRFLPCKQLPWPTWYTEPISQKVHVHLYLLALEQLVSLLASIHYSQSSSTLIPFSGRPYRKNTLRLVLIKSARLLHAQPLLHVIFVLALKVKDLPCADQADLDKDVLLP